MKWLKNINYLRYIPQVKRNRISEQSSILKQIWQHKILYLMLFPCVIFFFVFSYLPMAGMVLAFKEFRYDTGIWGGEWVGLKYYERFFSDSMSWNYIWNTLIISFMKLVLALPFPIILALMFNEIANDKLRTIVQSITYIPHFLSWVVVIGIVQSILAPNTGLVNEIIKLSGGDGNRFFLMEPESFYPIMFSSYVWKDIGWNSVIYFAAIVGISPQLYEAAMIDGANRLKQVLYVTIPSIMPTILVLFILSLGNILSAGFDQIYLLQTPGNLSVSEIIDTYVIKTGLKGGDFGYATAIGLIQGVIGLIIVLIVNFITHKKYETSLW